MGGATDALDLSNLRFVDDEGAPRRAVYRTCSRRRAVRTLQYSASLFRTAAIRPILVVAAFVGRFLFGDMATGGLRRRLGHGRRGDSPAPERC
jgi:hypothetical protein